MRRIAALALATIATLAAVPDASGTATGTIEGKAVDGTTGRPRAGVEVRLVAGDPTGETVLRRSTTTGDDGRYSFDELPTGDDHVYVVDAFFEGGLFAGRALRLPDDTATAPVIDTTVKVWRTTTDPTAIGLPQDDVFAIPSKDGLGVIESVSVLNSSELAYIGRGADAGGDAGGPVPTLGFALPDGAEQVQIVRPTDLDVPRLVATDFGFGVTVAVPPGVSRVTFAYQLPEEGSQFDLSHTALYATGEISVYARPPLTVQSNRLTASGEKSIEGTSYSLWKTDEGLVEPGDSVQLLLVAEAGRPLGLYAGAGGFVLLVLIGLGIGLRRRGKSSPPATASRSALAEIPGPGTGREDVLTAIALLDLEFENGELERATWQRRRDRLKERLSSLDAGS